MCCNGSRSFEKSEPNDRLRQHKQLRPGGKHHVRELPVILSPDEVRRLLAAVVYLRHRRMLRLRAADLDSDRGTLWVRGANHQQIACQ
jgi:integrase